MIVIDIPKNLLEVALINTLNTPQNLQVNFFHDLYFSIKEQFNFIFKEYGIIIDLHTERNIIDKTSTKNSINFALTNPTDYSRKAFAKLENNGYLSCYYKPIPCLRNLFSLNHFGDYIFVIKNKDLNKFEFNLNNYTYIKNITYNTSPKLKKPYIYIENLNFRNQDIIKLTNQYEQLFHSNRQTNEWITKIQKGYPYIGEFRLFINRITGEEYICSCFSFRNRENYPMLDNICHFCTKDIPIEPIGQYCDQTTFKNYYNDYYHLLLNQNGLNEFSTTPEIKKELENQLREHFQYPMIGKTGIMETFLYHAICHIFKGEKIIRRYRGRELEGLELDIWLPNIKLAIEYQGIQHYQSVEHWGGKVGLEERKRNDLRKKKICQNLGYTLLEVSGQLTMIDLINLIRPYYWKSYPNLNRLNCMYL